MAVSTYDARSTFVVHSPDNAMDALRVTPGFYQELDERYSNFHGHTLAKVSTEATMMFMTPGEGTVNAESPQ